MSKRYVCMAAISVPMCDDDGRSIEGAYSVTEIGTVWEITNNSVIGGEVHLEEVGKPWHWLEIPQELFEACFQEEE